LVTEPAPEYCGPKVVGKTHLGSIVRRDTPGRIG
jgi:hypothetical protein